MQFMNQMGGINMVVYVGHKTYPGEMQEIC